jgi:hypothetical protein
MTRKFIYFLSLIFLFSSCIREDNRDCPQGVRLRFSYTHNNKGLDLLTKQVRDIHIYLFDRHTGTLASIVSTGVQDIARRYIDIDIPAGIYTAIAWGGSSANMLQGGYRATAVIGITTLEQFRMMLDYESISGNLPADAVPKTADFDDLFYAFVENIPVVMNRRRTVDLSFIKNTNTLKVTVTGLQNLRSVMPVDIFTTGANWLYTYGNTPVTNTPRMLYLPQIETLTANNTMEVFIKQQRLHIGQSAANRVMFYIQDPATGTDVVAPLDLIAAIMQNPAYQTQQAIDMEDLFAIAVSISPTGNSVNTTVTITINGWEVVMLTPDPV